MVRWPMAIAILNVCFNVSKTLFIMIYRQYGHSLAIWRISIASIISLHNTKSSSRQAYRMPFDVEDCFVKVLVEWIISHFCKRSEGPSGEAYRLLLRVEIDIICRPEKISLQLTGNSDLLLFAHFSKETRKQLKLGQDSQWWRHFVRRLLLQLLDMLYAWFISKVYSNQV